MKTNLSGNLSDFALFNLTAWGVVVSPAHLRMENLSFLILILP